MKLLVTVPALYHTNEEVYNHLKFMIKSCEIQKIPLTMYGFPVEAFPGFIEITISAQLRFLENITEFTHVLYSDGGDAFFTGSLEEIIDKYNKFGSPEMLVATSNVFFPMGPWNKFKPDIDPTTNLEEYKDKYYKSDTEYFIPQVGGYIAEIPYLIDVLRKMMTYTDIYGGDNAHIWRDAWYEGWFRPERDTHCEIFQNFFNGSKNNLQMKNDRLYNVVTNSFPCVLHCNAGYTSPVDGKSKRITPIWEMVYGKGLL